MEVSAYMRAIFNLLIFYDFGDSVQEIVPVFNYKSAREARFITIVYSITAVFYRKLPIKTNADSVLGVNVKERIPICFWRK